MRDPDPVVIETRDRVRLVSLAHGVNALDEALTASLAGALDRLSRSGAPALVLASRHPGIFCPGLDLKSLVGSSRSEVREAIRRFSALLRQIVAYPGPTVAAVSGHAIGGGCLLALACDRRVMARSGARVGLSEINLGIPVPAGAVAMLLALYQTRAVEQLVLEGDGFGGERALELSLVERLADPPSVLDDACQLAAHLGSRPAAAYAEAKRFLRQGLVDTMAERDEQELECLLDHWHDEATQERMASLISATPRH